MPLYIKPTKLRDAVNRLIASRAQRGFTDFLILKRALKRAAKDIIPFSMKDPDFTGAIREVAAIRPDNTGFADDSFVPFYKVFGIAQGVSRKMLTNGSADTLSGPNWQGVIKLDGHRPRRGGLQSGYQNHLESLLLKLDGTKPTLTDAALWYYRATDVEERLSKHNLRASDILPSLVAAFTEDLALTQEEIIHLFDNNTTPATSLSVATDLQTEPSDPASYLPNDVPETNEVQRDIEHIAEAFEADATADSVGLRLPKGMAARFVAAALSKRFVILTGLSGSGKTKLAQAFARWITPATQATDPFTPGARIQGAQNSYTVTTANAGILELVADDGSLVALPMSIVTEWADFIEKNNISPDTSARDIRDRIEPTSKYISYLHRLESHYKPAALALLSSRRTRAQADCYAVIPVGADWTSSEHIIGYADALRAPHDGTPGSYVTKRALELIRRAAEPHRSAIPHFLILDEMNLSHVERYFADILSAIESTEPIPLHDGSPHVDGKGVTVEAQLTLPENLFVIGTVNVDETTYMFSPKVLDRANVIEFTVSKTDIAKFLDNPTSVDLSQLTGKGAIYANAFVGQANRTDLSAEDLGTDKKTELNRVLNALFNTLATVGAEFGYRPAYEISRFVFFHATVSGSAWNLDDAIDAAVMQKLLPKLHGSKTKLQPVIDKLKPIITERYRLSAAKIARMEERLKQNGFTSYTEA